MWTKSDTIMVVLLVFFIGLLAFIIVKGEEHSQAVDTCRSETMTEASDLYHRAVQETDPALAQHYSAFADRVLASVDTVC